MKNILTKVAVVSLGCSKNLVDTESMLGIITKGGCEITADEAKADVIIISTCCFIDDAKQESIDAILEAARQKEEGCCKALIVTGCLAQRYKEEILKEMPEVDYVVGVGHISDILSAINGTAGRVMCEKPYSHPVSERIYQTPEYSAYLKIADGCDNRCTYCIIPSIRGGFSSLPMEPLVEEAHRLAARGAKELILIAQDTTSYGVDLYPRPMLVPLLKELCKIDGIEWIRLHYCYPERITDELIDTIANEEKICRYFDIPIQHCNDDILRKMGRKTDKAHIEDIISKIRSKIPGAAIRTTLITGFPTETDEQYLEMLEFIERTKFDRLGVFTYSREEGTPAAKMKGQVDEDVKQQRREMLMLSQADIARQLSESKIGSRIKVLTEGYDALIKQYYGRSEADSADIDGKVFFTSKRAVRPGDFAEVEIDKAMDYDLFGKAVL